MIALQAGVVASPDLDRLLSEIERFLGARWHHLPQEQQGAELVQLRHGIDLLELAFSQRADGFAETDEYFLDGSVTPVDWIRHHCRMGGGAAAERVRVGDQLPKLGSSLAALCGGEIGFAHLALIAGTARAIEESTTSSCFDEEQLLAQARQVSVGRFRHLCHHARHASDPDGYAAEQVLGVETRSLRLSPCEDGRLAVNGVLDQVGGAALRTALEPLARRSGRNDNRSRERRLADALVDLATHALDTGQVPRSATQRAHLQVTTSLATLLGLAGAPAAELEFSLPISARTVERLACDCTLTRVLLGSDSAVIDVGRSKRVVAGATRRALNVRDRGCRWPGCERPASWSDAHHLVHWSRGGGTDLSNLALLCYRHHWLAHEGGWTVVRVDDGELLAIPPMSGIFAEARDPKSWWFDKPIHGPMPESLPPPVEADIPF